MLKLETTKWVRYEPSIPGNLDQPAEARFHLLLKAGMTSEEFDAFKAPGPAGEPMEQQHERIAAKFTFVAKVGAVGLVLDDKPITEPSDYLRAILKQSGWPLYQELLARIMAINSWEGSREVFSVRLSGSTGSTASQSSEPSGSQPAA